MRGNFLLNVLLDAFARNSGWRLCGGCGGTGRVPLYSGATIWCVICGGTGRRIEPQG